MVQSRSLAWTAASASDRTARLADGKLVKTAVVEMNTARLTWLLLSCAIRDGTWRKPIEAQQTRVSMPSSVNVSTRSPIRTSQRTGSMVATWPRQENR